MAGVIDLRDDLRAEMAFASQLGRNLGTVVNGYKRRRTEQMIVHALARANAQGMTPEQTREELLKIPNIVQTQIGQEMVQAQAETGRYYQSPFEQQYKKAQLENLQSLKESRNRPRLIKNEYGGWSVFDPATGQLQSIEEAGIGEGETILTDEEMAAQGQTKTAGEKQPGLFQRARSAVLGPALGRAVTPPKAIQFKPEQQAQTQGLNVQKTPPAYPRPELKDVWSKLSDEQKYQVRRALDNGYSIEDVLRALQNEGAK